MRDYLALLRVKGAPTLILAAFPARLAYGMIGLSLYFKIYHTTHSISLAGFAAGANALAGSLTTGFRASLLDRFGLKWPIRTFVPMYAISLLLVELASNASLLVAAAIALGISAPPINLSVRPLWRSVVPPEQLRIAYSLDTSSMSAATILGPVMATTLALSRHPASALITCSILILIGGIAVSLLEVVDNWEPEAKPANGRGLFRVPAIRILAIEGLVIGFGMGAFNIGLPALATLHHVPQATSKILAAQSGAMIIGSLLAGVATKKLTPLRAFATNYFFYFTATIPLIWLAPNWQMALGACWLGIFEGAAQVFFLEVLEAVRPIGAAASALGWMWMIEGSGGAIGNALGGAISDQFSPMWCFVILSLTTGAGGLMIYLGRRYFAAANRRFLMRN